MCCACSGVLGVKAGTLTTAVDAQQAGRCGLSTLRSSFHRAQHTTCLPTEFCVDAGPELALSGFHRPLWQLNTSRVAMARLQAKEARDAELLSLDALERHSCATLE